MDGLLEGLLGGLLSALGVDKKSLRPWIKALLLLILFIIVFVPLLLLLGKIELSNLLSLDFLWLLLGLYAFLFFVEFIHSIGKDNKEDDI